jgi:hypothetical protein
MHKRNSSRRLLMHAAFLLLLAGCERDGIKTYTIPKEPAKPAMAPPAAQPQSSAPPPIDWTLPPGWRQSSTGGQQFRLATLLAPGSAGDVEVTLTSFAGGVGGVLENVNRWRTQLGLQPIGESGIKDYVRTLSEPTGEITLVTIDEGGEKALLAAMVVPKDQSATYVIKAVGTPADIAKITPDLASMSRSIRPKPLEGAAAERPAAAAEDARAGIGERASAWVAPSHWQRAAGDAMVAVSYSASTEAGEAKIVAMSLRGDGGGVLANVNRWRGQVGLSPIESSPPADNLHAPGSTLTDVARADGSDRVVAVIVPAGSGTWYFRLRGNSASVERERSAFDAFVRAAAGGGE